MSEAFINQLAEKIVSNQMSQSWFYYAILLALNILTLVVASVISSYVRKRAETIATQADFEKILDQLTKTTNAAESIKQQISHADWQLRELKTIRRTKLEELCLALHASQEWASRNMNNHIYGDGDLAEADPRPKVMLLAQLYFPELLPTVKAFSISALEAAHTVSQHNISLKSAKMKGDVDAFKKASEEFSGAWGTAYKKLITSVKDVEDACPSVIQAIAANG